MSKTVLFALFSFFFSSVCSSQHGQKIEFFHGTFDQAMAKARQENKLLFVDVYTDWCGPCKTMDKDVFTASRVVEYFNNRFVNYKLNAEDNEFKGPEIAEKFEVTAYPTFLFFDDGKLVDSATGALDINLFMDVARRANGEGATFAEMTAKYQSGERGDDFMFAYFSQAKLHAREIDSEQQRQEFIDRISEQARQYLGSLNRQQLINTAAFQIIQNYTVGPYRGLALQEFVVDNYTAYTEIVTPSEVAQYVGRVNYQTIQKLARAGDHSYQLYLDDVRGKLAPAYQELKDSWFLGDDPYLSVKEYADSAYAIAIKDWDLYLEVCREHVVRMGSDIQVSTLVSISKDMLDAGCDDPVYLKKAVEYNRMAYEKQNTLLTSMAYGKLLAKLNDPRAKPVLQDAIAHCDKLGSRAEKLRPELEELLNAINGN